MKKTIIYFVLSLGALLLAGACQKDDTARDGEGAAKFSLGIRSTRATDYSVYPWTDCAIRIYRYGAAASEGADRERQLVRRYDSVEEMPQSLWLAVGDYAISVELGKTADDERVGKATWDEILYRGESDFKIVAGQSVDVAVECRVVNTIVEVEYDETVTDLFTDELWTNVALQETYNRQDVAADKVPYLHFTESRRGYFILPEGLEAFSWSFCGVGQKDGEEERVTVDGTKHISTLPGMCYKLRFKYSPDKGGQLTFEIEVDDTWTPKDDKVTFRPAPQIDGYGFEIDERQEFASGAISYRISAVGNLSTVKMTAAAGAGVEPRTWQIPVQTGSPEAGISVTMNSATDMLLTLGAEFFAQLRGGDLTLTFEVADEDGRDSEKSSAVRTQGVFDVTTTDAWNDRAQLKAYVFDEAAADVKIRYRESGSTGEWSEAAAEATAESGVYAASATIRPNTVYECQLQFGQKTVNGASEQRIEVLGPQVPNAGFEEWVTVEEKKKEVLIPALSTASQWWDSGNHGSATMSKQVTESVNDPRPGSAGTKAACLNSQFVGLGVIGKFAAGNIFFGKYAGTNGTNGVIGFGRPFDFTYRPRELTFWYKGTVGTIDRIDNNDGITPPVSKGDSDVAQVYICLCKMDGPHIVDTRDANTFFNPASKTVSYCTGTLNESSTNDKSDGHIIAWAEWTNQESSAEWKKITLTLHYNEEWEGEVPTYLMLTASASKYGDYFAGSTASVMYLDDFELVY